MTELNWFVPDRDIDSNLTKTLFDALDRLYSSSFDEFVKATGRAEALAALKPYLRASILTHVREARKVVNVDGNGPDALLLFFQMAQASIIPTQNFVSEINEKGAVEIVRECPFQHGSSDFCVYLSHLTSEYICEAVNPDYECIVTHHLTEGDSHCRFVFKKRSDPISVLDDPGNVIAPFPPLQIPRDIQYGMHLAVTAGGFDLIASAFAQIHGSEVATNALSRNANKIGREVGKELSEKYPELAGCDASIGHLVNAFSNMIMQQGSCSKGPSIVAEKEITSCSFQTFTKEVCHLYQALIQGMLESIDPSYEFAYDRMMTTGGITCHWTLRRREEPSKVEPLPAEEALRWSDGSVMDLLKMRLARGEITLDQYREIKKELEE